MYAVLNAKGKIIANANYFRDKIFVFFKDQKDAQYLCDLKNHRNEDCLVCGKGCPDTGHIVVKLD